MHPVVNWIWSGFSWIYNDLHGFVQKRRTHAGLLPLQKWRSKTGNMVTPGRCPNPSLPLQLSIQHCRSLVAPRALLRESEPAFMGHPEGECNLTAFADAKDARSGDWKRETDTGARLGQCKCQNVVVLWCCWHWSGHRSASLKRGDEIHHRS